MDAVSKHDTMKQCSLFDCPKNGLKKKTGGTDEDAEMLEEYPVEYLEKEFDFSKLED